MAVTAVTAIRCLISVSDKVGYVKILKILVVV